MNQPNQPSQSNRPTQPGASLPDPARSAAVLIGVSGYRHLPRLPTVANNLTQLKEALTDREIWGLPADNCVTVTDPSTSGDMIDPVISAATKARDLLIVYYAGHGFVDRHGAFHLTVVGSRDGARHTAVPYDWLREALLEHNRARRRVIVLDCCYSGRAIGDMSGPSVTPLRTAADVEGSYLLTSAAANVKALAPDKEPCTAFTGELVHVLRYGVPGEEGEETSPYLTLDMIYRQVRDALQGKNRPRPQQQDRGQIGRLPFVRNVAREPDPPPPSSRWRRCSVVVAAGVTVLAAGTSPLWWPSGSGTASAACSPRASLAGFSDRLDKSAFRGQDVYGLSSLTLTGESEALSLADNSPPYLYRLSLGKPGESPEPRITAMTQLRKADGTPYSAADKDFDGEAVALEKGGRTVLVASEAGPSVSRYSLETGRLLDDFPVPERFRLAGKGGHAVANAAFESLALTPDGRHLYVGLEEPLGGDGSAQGRELIRVLRYTGTPGGRYAPDAEFAYETDSGLRLADLTPTGEGDRFLALERGFTDGQGNSVHIYEISFAGLPDVTKTPSLSGLTSASPSPFVRKKAVLDLADCPTSGAKAKEPQSNPLLDNAEGIALGPPLTRGEYQGRRPLYLVTDDNNSKTQTTRFYTVAVTGSP
ncbi:caspase, EACC1-associated type [Streptomyces fulvoviolaceus]|uniref:caspase, EACC1-associated type n=1 Tax=Streptomyces fulvoviolaceus TaxID=285535 RepID=UPI0021BEA4ED|nr:esterase-like activity of phytase family protein [Streptomyces fulvoviolaceus]MCT9080256.1 esterase-like activity of phytase family protein [Streptomyces fulvoviolaceus]